MAGYVNTDFTPLVEYLVYGRKGCTQCEQAKRRLGVLGKIYEYKDIDELPVMRKSTLIEQAKKAKQIGLPIVVETFSGNIVDWRKVE